MSGQACAWPALTRPDLYLDLLLLDSAPGNWALEWCELHASQRAQSSWYHLSSQLLPAMSRQTVGRLAFNQQGLSS